MAIPDFLIQRLVVPNSFQLQSNGFSFSIQNNLIDAHIFSMRLIVVGKEIPPENVWIQKSETEKNHSGQINRNKPFIFSAGSQVSLLVLNLPPKDGKVKICLETLEVGEISFSLRVDPQRQSNLLQIFSRKETPDVIPATEPLFSLVQWEKARRDYEQWFDGSLDRNLVFFDNSGGFPLEFLENYSPKMKPDVILDHQQIYINGMACQADSIAASSQG